MPDQQFFAAADETSPTSFITILQVNDLHVADSTPITIKTSAFGCCTEEYSWSLPVNPLNLSIDNQGNISGISGMTDDIYTTTVRVEDKYDAGNFTEQSFNITVNADPDSNSIRIYNDGTLSLQINGISKENNSSWLNIEEPSPLPTLEPGSFYDIYVSADRQDLTLGNYNENIIISSNASNGNEVIVPVNLNITTDNTAPLAPQNISTSPLSWFSSGTVAVGWANPVPEDPSGINGIYYKIGTTPLSNSDGVFDANNPVLITPTFEGEQSVYLWLVDGAGNADQQNMNSTVFFFDNTAPSFISQYPENDETDIPVDSSIFINLEDAFSGIDMSTITMTVSGVTVAPVITGSQNSYSISYEPATPFNYGEVVNISLEASDFSSPANTMTPVVWSFSTVAQAAVPVINYFHINEGDNSTAQTIVLLNNSTSESPTEFMASELVDFSDTTWQTYSVAPSFTLSPGNDIKTVYFKVRNSAGESTVVSDTILFSDVSSDCSTLEVTAFAGSEIYTPPAADYQYHYGPSIILTGDIVDMWTCSPDPSPDSWDRIEHRRGKISEEGAVQWSTDWVSVLEATPNSRDQYSACDPGVFADDGYYYIGYTSTDQAEGDGATSNDVFMTRCDGLPDGSPSVNCEKWNGTGWGGLPQPIIEYNGGEWGIGQPSFVVKEDTLYVYYTDNGTKLAIADLTDVNWPSTLGFSTIPILVNDQATVDLGGKPGPVDVKYIDDLGRFVGVGVSYEFNPDSNVFVYESIDGLIFTPIVTSKDYWGPGIILDRAHNIGLSGDSLGHMQLSNTNFIAYSYGRPNGDPNATYNANWSTYLNPINFLATQENCLIAEFTANQTAGNAPFTVDFVDQSTGILTDWAWDFDNDGSVDSTERNPIYTFNNVNVYTVRLTVSGPNGFDFEIKPDFITVDGDSDKDGMPDDWEMFWFGSLDHDQSFDSDNDGYSDLQEYLNNLAGETDPQGGEYCPQVANAPDGIGYNPSSSNSIFWQMMLPAILGGNR